MKKKPGRLAPRESEAESSTEVVIPGSASASLKDSLVTKAGALSTSHRTFWDLLRAGQQHHQSHLVSCSRRWNLGGIDFMY